MKFYLAVFFTAIPFGLLAVSEQVLVNRVVDGDTVVVTRSDGQNVKLRIIGIDTPEIVATNRPIECFGSEASDYAKQLLPTDSTITLEHDQELDKYDRLLAYISLNNGDDFGKKMISDGYAYAYRTYDHERKTNYINTESRARLNKTGLWADDACRYSEQSIDQTGAAWRYYLELLGQFMKIIDSAIALFF